MDQLSIKLEQLRLLIAISIRQKAYLEERRTHMFTSRKQIDRLWRYSVYLSDTIIDVARQNGIDLYKR